MRQLLLLLVATIAAQLAHVRPSEAADPYRWCGNAGGADTFVNCYFVTLQQCQQAISGNSGYCSENLWYTGETAATTIRRKPHRTAR
jgi:Protein of unknown function (DUF3551)